MLVLSKWTNLPRQMKQVDKHWFLLLNDYAEQWTRSTQIDFYFWTFTQKSRTCGHTLTSTSECLSRKAWRSRHVHFYFWISTQKGRINCNDTMATTGVIATLPRPSRIQWTIHRWPLWRQRGTHMLLSVCHVKKRRVSYQSICAQLPPRRKS